MDLVRAAIPYSFLKTRARLSWREVMFGLDEELLDPRAPIDIGVERLMEEEHPCPELIEIAGMSGDDDPRSVATLLSQGEPAQPLETIRRKWLFLMLAWFFEHRDEQPDPLQVVEEVYADFGYPEEIAGFVRYMPSSEPDLGRQGNHARLLERWRTYVDKESEKYRP